jgi:hypothetical protein
MHGDIIDSNEELACLFKKQQEEEDDDDDLLPV